MPTEIPQPEPKIAGRRKALWFSPFVVTLNAIVVLIVLVPLLLRGWFLSRVPDIDQPFDVDEFCRVDIRPGQNAFDHYREAHRLKEAVDQVPTSSQTDRLPWSAVQVADVKGWGAVDDSVKAWLEAHRECLNEWRRGTEKNDSCYLSLREVSGSTNMPELASLHTFRLLSIFEAARLESIHDFAGAAEWFVALWRCGRHCCRNGEVIQALTGYSLTGTAADRLIRWAEYPDLTSDQLRTVCAQLKAADQMVVPESNLLKADYISVCNDLNAGDWAKELGRMTGKVPGRPLADGIDVLYWIRGEPQISNRVLRHILANQLQEIDKPLADRRPRSNVDNEFLFEPDPKITSQSSQLRPAEISQAIHRSILAKPLKMNLSGFDAAITRDLARSRIVSIVVAAQAYFRDHAEFPLDPKFLIPEYLDAWPIDPWSVDDRSIRYQRSNAESSFVWSIGQNGRDEDGDTGRNFDLTSLDFGVVLKLRHKAK